LNLLSYNVAIVSIVAQRGLIAPEAAEIGLRMALGAQRTDVLRLMLTQGLRMASLGVALGLLGSLLVRPLIASQLFGVGPTDLSTLIAVSLLFLGTAAAAIFIPARRAMRVDPLLALRYE